MRLKDCRRLFLAVGYSKPEYDHTLASFGKGAEVWLGDDCIIVQQPGYPRFIHHPFKEPPPEHIVANFGHAAPINAEFLFYLFLDAKNCDAIVGDLVERCKLIHKKFGARRASFWYRTQAIRSVGPIVWAWGKKIALKPVIGVVAWAVAKRLVTYDSWLAALVEIWKRIRS